jgi:hypothetical protein
LAIGVAMGTSRNRIKLETSPRHGKPEAWRLPRAAQLAPVPGLPPIEAPTAALDPGLFEPEERTPSLLLPRLTRFLIASAIAASLAGYFVFASSRHPVNVMPAPQPTIDASPVASLQSAQAVPPAAEEGTMVESGAEREIEARSPQTTRGLNAGHQASLGSGADAVPDVQDTKPFIEPGGQMVPASAPASTCFFSASAVRLNQPGAWPSWTLRAPGHEGTRCWYAATRATARDHRVSPAQ